MAITVKSLAKATLPGSEGDLYVAPTGKAAIVKSIRLVNTGSGVAVVNLYIRRATGGTSYRIAPKDLNLAGGSAYIDGSEVTVEGLSPDSASSDRIRGYVSSGGPVDYVLSGIERDA
jgi:hypothetical protein